MAPSAWPKLSETPRDSLQSGSLGRGRGGQSTAPAQPQPSTSVGGARPRHAAPATVFTEGRATAHRVTDDASTARRGGKYNLFNYSIIY